MIGVDGTTVTAALTGPVLALASTGTDDPADPVVPGGRTGTAPGAVGRACRRDGVWACRPGWRLEPLNHLARPSDIGELGDRCRWSGLAPLR